MGNVRDPSRTEEYPAASCCQHLKSRNALLPPGSHVVLQQLFGSNANLFGLAWYLWHLVVCEASSIPRCQSIRELHLHMRPRMLGAYPWSIHGAGLSFGKWNCQQLYSKQVEALFINCHVYLWLESGIALGCPENLYPLAREGKAPSDKRRLF